MKGLKGAAPANIHRGLTNKDESDKLKKAVESGQTNLVLSLLKIGAPVTIDNDGQTALHLASAAGHESVVDALIQSGCDVSIQDFTGHTPLQRAAAEGHIDILKLLIKNGANIDHQDEVHGNTSLHEAAWKGFSQSVQFLTRVGKANCYMKNRGGFAPLHLCCQNGHNETCRILLLSGCKPDIKNNYGDTPLHTSARYGHAGVVRILVSGKCNPSEQNKNGDTALHIAAAMGRRKLTKVLIESGCSKETKKQEVAWKGGYAVPHVEYLNGSQNETAMDIASRKNLIDIIQILQSVEPNVSIKRDASSPATLNAALRAALEEMSSDVDAIKPAAYSHPLANNKTRRSSRGEKQKKFSSRRRRHSGGSEDVDGVDWSSYRHFEPNLEEFSFSNPKGLPKDHLKTGEQYFLDLAGNIRKGPLAMGRDCVCSPLIKKMERRLDRDKKEIVRKINGTTSKLDSRIAHLERKTKDHLFSLNQAMKESFANERGDCMDRMDRRALRERIAIERQQVLRDLSLKRDLAAWLESKLTEIEKKHGLDAKNAALLRAMAMKRFSKYGRSQRKLLHSDNILGSNLRRAHSEELLSEGLKVSDRPVQGGGGDGEKSRRTRRNSEGDESSLLEEDIFGPRRFLGELENQEVDDSESMTKKKPFPTIIPKIKWIYIAPILNLVMSNRIIDQIHLHKDLIKKRISSYEDDKNVYENTLMGGGNPKEIIRPIPTGRGIPMNPSNESFKNHSSYLPIPTHFNHNSQPPNNGPEEARQYRRELNNVQRQLFPPQQAPSFTNNSTFNRPVAPQVVSFNSNYPSRSIRPMSPLDEDDYVGHNEIVGEKEDFHRQLLNIPMTSDGGGSHDSHNDSGYSTRLGFSAGPSPSLSGSRPESNEGDHPHYQNTNGSHLLLDPMAINMIPPEMEQFNHPRQNSNGPYRIHEINQRLHNVDLRSGCEIQKQAPKGSLV
ncbi:ANKRD6 [Lepeophtheirus salmonis]|uniref:ANKRD6 n=1 Tax=Lepeophtheirus salmonis TaxID=72036 RepID=A0A7R8D1W0_LEPSM|nr:ANKRD6 [Lepeophtheirus salmonis]CAF2999655.1 ANKRD6 [Lepeophtheirus salmonis]